MCFGCCAKQCWCESNFDRNARSPANAKGICQFVDETAAELGIDPWDPRESIFGIAEYVLWSEERWDSGLPGRTRLDMRGLRAGTVNWGLGNMRRDQERNGWVLYLEAEPHLPAETQAYFWCLERGSRS